MKFSFANPLLHGGHPHDPYPSSAESVGGWGGLWIETRSVAYGSLRSDGRHSLGQDGELLQGKSEVGTCKDVEGRSDCCGREPGVWKNAGLSRWLYFGRLDIRLLPTGFFDALQVWKNENPKKQDIFAYYI